jgi:hypothetical protein
MTEDQTEYFTAVEEHFQRARRTPFFRFSRNDWGLIERWKASGVPLEAVLRGIDRTFEKMRSRTEKVNSLAYCVRAIESEARALVNVMPYARTEGKPPFRIIEVQDFVAGNARTLREKGHKDLAAALESIDLDALYSDLEQLERQLRAIEERMMFRLRAAAADEALLEAGRALNRKLQPYRQKMTAEQLARLEKQFLEQQLLESAGLPRLSLFYLQAWPDR